MKKCATHVDKLVDTCNNLARVRHAFTLAEVLITLGIIGVVAAMTMPTLIQKQNERETVVRLKKIHSVLSFCALVKRMVLRIRGI